MILKMSILFNPCTGVRSCAARLYSMLRANSLLPDLVKSFNFEVKSFHAHITPFLFEKWKLRVQNKIGRFHFLKKDGVE